MKNISFFIKIYKSIVKPKSYILFYKLSLRNSLKYLLAITLLLGAISYIRPAYDYYKFLDIIYNNITKDFPEFSFISGTLHIDGNQPLILQRNNKYILIDTTGNTTESVLSEHESMILVLKDRVYYKKNNYNVDEASFDILQSIDFDKSDLIKYISIFKTGTILIIIVTPILLFIANMFLAFYVSLLGALINSVLKAGIRYKDLYKLSIYSITLPILISCTIRIIDISIPFINHIYIFIGFIYLFIAIKNIILEQTRNLEE
ncbi:hypothetical protein CPJCM30710_20420 [Clostridium polyendosporum]|uniref:DUF1189 domain-containing protein n=1 Tax=Clostridium polyendosporum TaxID=69208 RepID=A0A919RZV8_9CLOT|nr:DUF1189 domain-containing protein [Clostridium polyendosporum]GIM29376.1 hypothetical protein CPJCM30710_20420 [Clostridium polyendosporum]